MQASLLFLGTGASTGVPMIGCSCPICSSTDPHNHRLRPSALLTLGKDKILIDVGPDFRSQALFYEINHLDGVLLTHSHYDHVAGLDELRTYYILHQKILPILVSQATMKELKKRYDYFFKEKSWGTSLAAQLDFHILEKERGETHFLDHKIHYTTYEQGGMKVTGYRFGSLAYISDICEFPNTIFEDLEGIETLVISALREKPSKMHLSIEHAIQFANKVGAKQTYFTHIGHEVDHHTIQAQLPKGVELAYDGLKLEWTL